MRRRDFLHWTGGFMVAILAAGCGGSDSDTFVFEPGGGAQAPPTATRKLSRTASFEVDASGRVLEIDTLEGTVKGYNAQDMAIFTSSEATSPVAATFGPDGSAYILDLGGSDVVVLSPSGELVRRFGTRETLDFGIDIAFGNDEVYILDQANLSVDVFSPTGQALRKLEMGPAGSHFRALLVDSEDNLRVLNSNPVEVQVRNPRTGDLVRSYGTDQARSARDLAVAPDGSSLVVDHIGLKVLVFNPAGDLIDVQTPSDQAGDTSQPLRISLGADGDLYLSISEVSTYD